MISLSGVSTHSSPKDNGSFCPRMSFRTWTVIFTRKGTVINCRMLGTQDVCPICSFEENTEFSTARPEGKASLPFAVVRAFKWDIALGVPVKIAFIAFSSAQPFIINRAISLVSEADTESSKNAGVELVGATVLLYLGLAVSILTTITSLIARANLDLVYQQDLQAYS
jgi:hypothetical protein